MGQGGAVNLRKPSVGRGDLRGLGWKGQEKATSNVFQVQQSERLTREIFGREKGASIEEKQKRNRWNQNRGGTKKKNF